MATASQKNLRARICVSNAGPGDYDDGMALVRILVDGYSLLHGWPELAPGKPRHSAAARDELIQILTRYHDATGTPITVFFDGTGARSASVPEALGASARRRSGTARRKASVRVEVLFSRAGWTADQMIERVTHRFQAHGDVLAVTDDQTERDVVTGLGGSASSCENFIRTVEGALVEFQEDLKHYNRVERNRYQQSR